MTEKTTKTTTMETTIMRRNTRVTIIVRRNTRVTTIMRRSMETTTMEDTITIMTMTVLLKPKKENMNKLPNRQLVTEGPTSDLMIPLFIWCISKYHYFTVYCSNIHLINFIISISTFCIKFLLIRLC